ncbi:arsenic resistance protein [Paenibacillus radicis (ex Gao et al. 2016)]|uniref:Arsenic resistance protein n=1 Tax=Paenibacillus radicis (ex Gao et al. 2016) TaxID=1737354 RepID=A0A917GX13_9BACL|nr:arsenic resistance protein [Paenibacillus radicis (ex Gao et al. 2016)]GGG59721.1 arsenic resistance protein [Paenibacillus radicis (ex Gao et al. 2016)]
MITREKLEQQQIWVYVVALVIGGIYGAFSPEAGSALHIAISPLLAILLYSMFAQIPFLQLRESLSNAKFIGALLVSNFVVVPVVVWTLTQIFPQSQAVLTGLFLVLLTPCIDYVIVFTQLGRGNERLMLAATPILFVVQMALLPLYLWLFLGKDTAVIVKAGPFAEAFFYLIVIPLLLAIATQLWANKRSTGTAFLQATAWLPVPFMALVLVVVVASQIGKIIDDIDLLLKVIPIYVGFHLVMPLLSRLVVKWFRLDTGAGRAVLFSSGTRNSLVVLPLALALPGEWATIAAAVIVTQTIVELIAELFYIRLVPSFLLRDAKTSK